MNFICIPDFDACGDKVNAPSHSLVPVHLLKYGQLHYVVCKHNHTRETPSTAHEEMSTNV